MDKIVLLDTDLLQKKELFKEVTYWKNLLGLKIGWHYILDLIWQLERIEALNLPKGALILDAGAGYGLLQYILAARGFNVISVDFRPRKLPWPMKWIFPMFLEHAEFKDPYIEFIKKNGAKWYMKIPFEIKRILFNYNVRIIPHFFKRYNSILFYQANFKDMDLIDDGFIDAIVSTSAIEHIRDIEDIKIALKEFKRVLKPGRPMIITTSAAKETFYMESTHGWCFSRDEIRRLFDIKWYITNFDSYVQIYLNVTKEFAKEIKKRFGNPTPGYIAVGVEKW
jgi:ubiquinone/menaquinone biosynthesis C-methylase UbiE